jgi:maleate isomerase
MSVTAAKTPDYGPRARVGVATPQANPTVEPEMRLLLPAAIAVYGTRLTHGSPAVEERLHHYIRHIPDALRSFGSLKLAVFGFGCTGSSYLAGRALEDQLTAQAAADKGIPVITAAQAIRQFLDLAGARRIALVSPYPVALAEAGYSYWRDSGIDVVGRLRVDPDLIDTHNIYELTSADALAAVRKVEKQGADCIVASGTGMPTLRALQVLHREGGLPVVSSNLCLAWAMLRVAAPELAPPSPAGLLGGEP